MRKKPETIDLLVRVPSVPGMTRQQVLEYVRDNVRDSIYLGLDHPLREASKKITVKVCRQGDEPALAVAGEQSAEAKNVELFDAYQSLQEDHAQLLQALGAAGVPVTLGEGRVYAVGAHQYISPVQVINALVREVNAIQHQPPKISWSKTEYWKAGARETLKQIGQVVLRVGQRMIAEQARPTDGQLFSFWVEESMRNPGRLAKALAVCTTPDDVREALQELHEVVANELSTEVKINPEGGLQ